ncbi:bestrophin-like domain [Acidisoma sp. 7E03]
MTYFSALLVVVAAFLVPAVASYLISRRTHHESRRQFHEVGIAVFLQMGVILAVIIAFVFTNVWDQFNDASNAVDREALDLQNMADRSAYLPPEAAAAVRQALARYVQSEVESEWPAMARRQISPQTTDAFTHLFAAVAAVPLSDALVVGTRESLLHLTSDVRDQRQLRLFQLETNVPPWVWGLLIGFSGVLVLFVMASGVGHHGVQSVLVGIFAAFLATILVTIHLLDYPFEGSIRIAPETLVNTLAHVNDIPIVPLRSPQAADTSKRP